MATSGLVSRLPLRAPPRAVRRFLTDGGRVSARRGGLVELAPSFAVGVVAVGGERGAGLQHFVYQRPRCVFVKKKRLPEMC